MFLGWCLTKCKLMSTQVLCLHNSGIGCEVCAPLFAFHYLKTHFIKIIMLTETITITTP